MKKIVFMITLIILNNQIFSQNLLAPIESESFGLNNHTSRDISYFCQLDTNKNLIIVGTTEKDTTFTDIITTKLDENYNLIWQKKLSHSTNLSYDIPVKTFISSNNEIYIISRSSFNQSMSNGLIFVTKFDEDGNIVYNQVIGNINGSDYVDYSYLNADLNDDGTINLVYSPDHYQANLASDFNFLKISNQGDILSSFTREIPRNDLIGKIKNDIYYFLVKELIDNVNYIYSYKFYRIQNENDIAITDITDSTFTNYYDNAIISDQVKLTIDNNENCYLICHNINNNEISDKINISKIDTSNTFTYSINTSDDVNYYLIDSFINDQNENIVIVNNIDSSTIDFLSIDENNTLQTVTNPDNFLATGFKKNQDDSFFIATSNSNIRLFSNELNELKSFNTSNTYELTDFLKIDNQSIATIGTSYAKMFPESDFYTQLDIHSEKINDTEVLYDYSFSGNGTSRAFQQKLIIDNDNNYLVLVEEKMGPEYLGIGGTNPPVNYRIIKYNPELVKLWESEAPDNIFGLVGYGGRDVDYFIDDTNNLYLNLPREGDDYGLGYDLYKVTPSGNFEFINSTYVIQKFYTNEDSIFMAKNYFLYEDSSKMYILDKESGNLINEINVGHEEFLDIFSIGDDYYFYTYEEISNNTPDYIYLYKNGIKIYTRYLSNNYGIFPYEIDNSGTLYFVTENGPDRRLNKLDINNNYTFYNTPSDIIAFKKFENGNIFLFLENDGTLVIDNNLNFIVNGEVIDSEYPYLMSHEDYILFGTSYDNRVRIIDMNGVVINSFNIQGFLHNQYSKFDSQGNLIMVGQFGNKIYTFNEYAWFRGFIHKYETLNNILNIDDYNLDNLESDLTVYPNPTSDILNIKLQNLNIEKVILYDLSGKELKEVNQSVIDLKDFKSGLYFIKVFTNSGEIISSKIIKN